MDKHYTYLLINFLTILFPVLLSFDKRVQYYKQWKYVFPGLFLTGALFLVWDYLFTVFDVWSFNSDYVTGVWFLDLPLEEILFFVTVPFSCIFIYECLNHYVKRDILGPYSRQMSVLFAIVSLLMLILYYSRVYTLITFGLMLVLMIYVIARRSPELGRFYAAYLISLIPFYVVNGLLTSIPVVLYNDRENLGIRVGTIPFEDHFYSLALLLINILFFEHFRGKKNAV